MHHPCVVALKLRTTTRETKLPHVHINNKIVYDDQVKEEGMPKRARTIHKGVPGHSLGEV